MILFTADYHLKLGQKNVPREWALNRYKLFFEQIYEIKCDIHIIGGDIFDRLPSMEELELFFRFIESIKVPTLIFDGNHEATKKNKTFFTHLKIVSNKINSNVQIIDDTYLLDTYSILPYCNLHMVNSIEKIDNTKPLFTHVRGEIPPHVKPEVDLDRFNKFPIIFAGDLHAHSNSQRNIVYPGSPMTTSFHRTEVKTGYILINELDWSWEWKEFQLPQLIRKTISDPKDILPTDYNHTIYELEGDMQELSSIKNSELLDKKVVKRSNEAALIMHKDMSIAEELSEYLTYILGFKEEKITNIMKLFNDHIQKAKME